MDDDDDHISPGDSLGELILARWFELKRTGNDAAAQTYAYYETQIAAEHAGQEMRGYAISVDAVLVATRPGSNKGWIINGCPIDLTKPNADSVKKQALSKLTPYEREVLGLV